MNSFELRHISNHFADENNFFFDVFYLIISKTQQVLNEYTESTARLDALWKYVSWQIRAGQLFVIQED